MSHELEMVNGQASMAWAGETPWHGLGKQVPADLTPIQMLEAAGLDWEVKKVKVRAEYKRKPIVGLNIHALVRTSDNKFLTSVSDTWNPCQNLEAFEFFNDFVSTGDMEMHTAGSLHGGRMVWALAKVSDSFELFGGDKVEGYLLFSNPHQFGKSIDIRFTPVRVVCNNTISLALNLESKHGIRINHRKKFDGDEVKLTLGIAHEQLQRYKEKAEFLGTRRYTNENVVDYFKRIFPVQSKTKEISRNAELCMEILETQPGAEFAEGTFWQLHNAVTFVTNHLQGRSADNRVESMWYGANKDRNLQSLDLAVEMANAA